MWTLFLYLYECVPEGQSRGTLVSGMCVCKRWLVSFATKTRLLGTLEVPPQQPCGATRESFFRKLLAVLRFQIGFINININIRYDYEYDYSRRTQEAINSRN